MANVPGLPQDIWWLVMRELSNRHDPDFVALYHCALVSKALAGLALPQLYSIHDTSPAMTSDTVVYDASMAVVLWRSIICSSLGETVFPYCLWVKALSLGNLHELLEVIAKKSMRKYTALLFSPPLESFRVENKARITRNSKGQSMDIQKVVVHVADSITRFIKASAIEENRAVTLATLEGLNLPTAKLTSWVSTLSQLTSLRVRDGSVLNSDVGRAIRESCPSFKEVGCFYCQGTEVDQDLAGFLGNLAPNTLESFTISSINEIGQEAFKALSAHSSSLKYLVLQSLQRPALTSLNILCHCRALEKFTLEASTIAEEFEWQSTVKQVFEHVVPWLSACADLRTLEMTKVPNATALLGEVLKSPDVRLTMLSVKLLESDETFFSSLGHQTQLRHLLIDAKYLLDVSDPRHTKLVDSICSCPELRELTLQNGPLERVDLQRICQRAPLLEDLTFEGEVTDEVLPVLAQLSHLKVLTVNGLSLFSFVGLHSFIQQLAMDEKASHANISISVADQTGAKLSEDEEALVQMEVARLFNGRFEVTDRQDPDELHQSDFSD